MLAVTARHVKRVVAHVHRQGQQSCQSVWRDEARRETSSHWRNAYSGGVGTRFAVVRYGERRWTPAVSVIPLFLSLAGTGVLPINERA